MTQARRIYRPVIVRVPDGEQYAGTYEVHLAAPERPRIYRRVGIGAEHGGGRLVRVSEGQAAEMLAVLRWLRLGIAQRKAEEAAQAATERVRAAQKQRWTFRFGVGLRVWLRRLVGWI